VEELSARKQFQHNINGVVGLVDALQLQ
jgi:hypothetical protein